MGKKLIIIAVLLIIIGFISFFLLSFMKDKSDNKNAMGVIESDYKVFENDVVEFNNYRDTIYEKVFSDSYFDAFKNNYINFNKMVDDYNNMIDKIYDKSNNLKIYCDDKYYTRSDINTMCSNFNNGYEVFNNSFVKDVKNYNTLIKEYNNYLDENNINDNKLSSYKTNKKYIDYNKDKKFEGKE